MILASNLSPPLTSHTSHKANGIPSSSSSSSSSRRRSTSSSSSSKRDNLHSWFSSAPLPGILPSRMLTAHPSLCLSFPDQLSWDLIEVLDRLFRCLLSRYDNQYTRKDRGKKIPPGVQSSHLRITLASRPMLVEEEDRSRCRALMEEAVKLLAQVRTMVLFTLCSVLLFIR